MIVRLADKHLHLALDQSGKVLAIANLSRRHPDAVRIERLALTISTPHLDGETLHVDAAVIVALVTLIGLSGEYRTGRAIDRRLHDYLPNEMHGHEIVRATIRAAFPRLATAAVGEEGYWLARVKQQRAAHRTASPWIAVRNGGGDPVAVHVGPPVQSVAS